MPWGTALTIIMTIVLVVTSLRSGPASIVWSLYNTDADKYREQYKLLHDLASEISIAAGIPTPEVVIITDTDPNAFAVGIRPENSYIMVTTGLISTLDREELQGVIAHEMSHIRNNDTELMTVITVLFGGLLLLADWMKKIVFWNAPAFPKVPGTSMVVKFVFFIFWMLAVLFAPIIARILAMSVSREREYLADAGGAELTRNPLALANALAKIENHPEPTRSVPKSIAHLCVVDPLGLKINKKEGFWSDLFGTHPPIEKRIMLLRSMAYQG
jgi:heat shock protein HtpX